MSAFKKNNQPDRPQVLGYSHNVLVILSGLFLIAIATATIVLLHFSPDNEYIPMDLELTTRLDLVVYLSAALALLGLIGLVILTIVLLHCLGNKKQRAFVLVYCLVTTLLTLGILVLFAVQPQVLVDQVLPQDDVIFQPINESYAIAMEKYGHHGNEEITQNLKKLQIEANCCVHSESEQNDVNCIVITTEATLSRPTESCIQYFYDYYLDWLHQSQFIIQVMAIVFCAILGISIFTNIWLLISLGQTRGGYTVEKRRPSKYRENLSSFTYVAFQSGASAKESPAGTLESKKSLDETFEHTLESEIFYIAKNEASDTSEYGSSICVMHNY